MANKYGASEFAGSGNGSGKGKVAARKAARKESGMSAQKFYVKTRMAEAAKGGKTVNAKDLRKKFQSGDVARKGFGAPKKKTSSGYSAKNLPMGGRSGVDFDKTKLPMGGYKNTTTSVKSNKK